MKPHSLLEFLTTSRPSDPSAGSAFRGVPSPSTTSLGLAPYGARYQSRPGSALRLSQPPSGFLADPSFAALFHAATVPGVLPSESSPHRNRAPLSRPLLLPCGHPPACWTPPHGPCHRRFRRLPRFHAVAWFPTTTMGSLFTRRSTLPDCPGSIRRNSPVPPASPTPKP
jgi:hypothetical protein